MSETPPPGQGQPDQSELQSARFAQLVMQQANMAFLLMGRTPHPESGKTVRDLEAAQLFIGQLEMLEAKTKGNLSRDEAQLLQQSLMSLRMAFVEAVAAPAPPEGQSAKDHQAAPAAPAAAAQPEESGKRFSKSYPT